MLDRKKDVKCLLLTFFCFRNRAPATPGYDPRLRKLREFFPFWFRDGAHKIRFYLHYHVLPSLRYVSTYIIAYYFPSGTFLLTLLRTTFPQVRFYLHYQLLPSLRYVCTYIITYYLPSGTFLLTFHVLPFLRYVSTYIVAYYLLSGTFLLTLLRTTFPQVRFFLHYHVLPSLRYVSIYIITY